MLPRSTMLQLRRCTKLSALTTRNSSRRLHATSTTRNQLQNEPERTSRPLTEEQKHKIRSMIRVNQAGELGADRIYRGQHFVLGSDSKVGDVIKEMWEQEKVHLKTFDDLVAHHGVRPTALRPLWNVAGFALGVGTALMGREAAMACTEAVETVIGEHYNDQLRELVKMEGGDIKQLREIIKQFRDEELHHLDTAVHYDSEKAPMYPELTAFIKQGCKVAISLSQKI